MRTCNDNSVDVPEELQLVDHDDAKFKSSGTSFNSKLLKRVAMVLVVVGAVTLIYQSSNSNSMAHYTPGTTARMETSTRYEAQLQSQPEPKPTPTLTKSESRMPWIPKNCALKLAKVSRDPSGSDECFDSIFPFPISDSATFFGSHSFETKLSASVVRHVLPDFKCSNRHQVRTVAHGQGMAFVYDDKTTVIVDGQSCRVTALFASESGVAHPLIEPTLNEPQLESKKVSIVRSDFIKIPCTTRLGVCFSNGQCCSGRCKAVCLQAPGQECASHAQCDGYDATRRRAGDVRCCRRPGHPNRCEHLHETPEGGPDSTLKCGPRLIRVIRSRYNLQKGMALTHYADRTHVTMYPVVWNSQKWYIFANDKFRIVQLWDRKEWVWHYNADANRLEIRRYIKNDCNKFFKFEQRGDSWVIKTQCDPNICLDLSNDKDFAPVVGARCHYHTAQLWYLH